MATDPIVAFGALGTTGGRQGVAPMMSQAAVTPPQQADPTVSTLAMKQNLDQRETAWQGIAGNQTPAAESTPVVQDDSKITDAELDKLFGSEAGNIRQLLNTRSDLHVKDLLPLRKDANGLSSVTHLLLNRNDLKLDDLMTKDRDGKVKLNPVVTDPDSSDLMVNRQDVKPTDLSNMQSVLARAFRNPALAQQAYTKSIDLLKTRADLKPQDVGQMVAKMSSAVKGSGGDGPQGGAALMSMFDSASEMLKTRTDISAKDVNQLVDATSDTFASKKDPNALSSLTQGFDKATKFLQGNKGADVSQVTNVMSTLNKHLPGDGNGADRLEGLDKATQLMTNVPQMDAKGVDTMFQKSAEGPPPQKGAKLLKAFGNASDDVMKGVTDRGTATTLRSQQTNQQAQNEKQAMDDRRIREGRPRTEQEQQEHDAHAAGRGNDTPGLAGAPTGGTVAPTAPTTDRRPAEVSPTGPPTA
jgi:hypothetical protein